jgi:hypothetical protein
MGELRPPPPPNHFLDGNDEAYFGFLAENVNNSLTCYLFYGFQPCYGDGVTGIHDGGCVGLLPLLVIYFMVFSHATGTVSLAYMMVDVWDCSLYLLFILWFSAMLRGRCPWPT